MATVTYIGPHDAVDVPDAGLVAVARGESVDVPEDLAAALLEQGDNWAAEGDPVPFDVTPAPAEEEE